MKNFPLLMAAGHTLCRRFIDSCKYFVWGTLHGVYLLMLLLFGVGVMVAGLMSSFILIIFPFQLLKFLIEGKANPLFSRCPEGIFFHLGQPTALSLFIYMGVVLCLYVLSMAYAFKSGAAHIEMAKSGKSKTEALLYSAFCMAGQGYASFINQVLCGKIWGWSGLLAAPLRHGFKILLSSVAMPWHVVALMCIACIHIFKFLKNIYPKGQNVSLFGDALARLAQQSPEVLARHEARALKTQARECEKRSEKPRL